MTGAGTFVYRFLKLGKLHELPFGSIRDAFDRACEDLESEDAMPIEITGGSEVLFSSFDIYTLCDTYFDWKAGRASHPLSDRSATV